MAEILLTTLGSAGDVFPFVPLAVELKARGHNVTAVVPGQFVMLLRRAGLSAFSSGRNITQERAGSFLRTLAAEGAPAAKTAYWRFGVMRHAVRYYEALVKRGRAADAIVAHVQHPAALALSLKSGRPLVAIGLGVSHFPSRQYPPSDACADWDGRKTTRSDMEREALWRQQAADQRERFAVDNAALSGSLGLPNGIDWLHDSVQHAKLRLILGQRAFLDAAGISDPPAPIVGYPLWDGGTAVRVPEAVAEFLGAGDPPVLVTLGTAVGDWAERYTDEWASQLTRNGLRVLFLTGVPSEQVVTAGSTCLAGFVPHSGVVSSCSAVIHHGGVGTLAVALGHGKVSVIVPHLADQFLNAQLVLDAGVGCVIQRRELRDLGVVVASVLKDRDVARKAESLRDAERRLPRPEVEAAAAIESIL